MSLSGDIDVTDILEILSLCTGINNLALMPDRDRLSKEQGASVLRALNALPLKVLSLHINFRLNRDSITSITFIARLTHLDIDDEDMLSHLDLESLPQLTHLALWGTLYNPNANVPSLVKRLLSHPTLQTLIFRTRVHKEIVDYLDLHKINDPRIIIAPEQVFTWDDLGRASMLLWEIADGRAKVREPNHSQSIMSIMKAKATNHAIQGSTAASPSPPISMDYEII
jgi:hypothetical protein